NKKPLALISNDHERYKNPYKNSVIGRISDKYATLPLATVQIKGKTIAVQTDIDGYFGIDAKIGDILIIQYIGYETSEIKVTHPIMNVVLQENTMTLSEVVVTGYTTKHKAKMTSSVERVSVSESVVSDKEMLSAAALSTSGSSSTAPKAG
ncbi:MAG: carboxypeptidase-like regulatory domain-containing protein, partial [Flavobacterium stagni]